MKKRILSLLLSALLLVSLLPATAWAAGSDWNSLQWLTNTSSEQAYTECFKVDNVSGVTVNGVEKPSYATEPGILITCSQAPSGCSLDEGNFDVSGQNICLHASAFTNQVTDVTISWSGGTGSLTVYNKSGTAPAPTKPDDAEWLVDDGDNHVWYKLTEVSPATNPATYTLTIGGTGAMPDYENVSTRPWYSSKNTITTAMIESGITSIGDNVFNDCTSLTSVTIPASVTTIGNHAFRNCKSLTGVSIPAGVTTIGNGAFNYCSALTSVTIPAGVTTINDYTFRNCSSLTNVIIPKNVKTIGQYAFGNCSSLTSVTVEATTPPALGSNAIPANVKIYVPAESVEAYTGAAGWSTYAEKIVSYSAITNNAPESDSAKNHGYITIDKETAAEGETVTLTVEPASGYQLKSLSGSDMQLVTVDPSDTAPDVNAAGFGGSTVRNGNFFGHNFDYYINDKEEVVIKTEADPTSRPHAVIGVANPYSLDVTGTAYDAETLKQLAWLITDGINDAGLVCSINGVSTADITNNPHSHTNSGTDEIMVLHLVRAILDNCETVSQAKTFIANHDITPLSNDWDAHIMLADATDTVIVEFTGNGVQYTTQEQWIMTDFYNHLFKEKNFLRDRSINNFPYHAIGMERYFILSDFYATANTRDGMAALLEKVTYTKTYNKSVDPFWCSEFYRPDMIPTFGEHPMSYWTKEKVLAESTPTNLVNKYAAYQTDSSKPADGLKHTAHSSIYNIRDMTLTVTFGDGQEFIYDFDGLTNPGVTPEKQNDGTYQFTMPAYAVTVTAEFEPVPAPVYYGGGDSSSTITVPVSGDENSVKISATISGSTATVKPIADAELAKVADGESVAIDLSGAGKNVDTAKIPTETVEKISEKSALTVKLPVATVEFDKTATQEISDQADGKTIELVVDDVKEVSLNALQKKAVSKLDTALIIDAHLVSNSSKLCTADNGGFGGGKAKVILPYEIKNNRTAANYSVYYVDDAGKLEKLSAAYDKELAAFVFEIEHFSVYAVAYDEYVMPFVDVPETAYYYDAVKWAAANAITSGTDATHFNPLGITSRAQMVTFLWRAAGEPEPAVTSCKFTDVKADAYYYKAVLWAVEKGITDGTGETTFSPNMNVSRAQAVTFLVRMSGVKDNATGYTHKFADVKATAYYNNAVAWAYENKITDGTSETTFSPNADCLRNQIVCFLYRNFVK